MDGQSEIDKADAAMWEEEEEFVVEVDGQSEIDRADNMIRGKNDSDNVSDAANRVDDGENGGGDIASGVLIQKVEDKDKNVAGERGKTKDIRKKEKRYG